jgi:hypothetical protein
MFQAEIYNYEHATALENSTAQLDNYENFVNLDSK